MKVDVVLPAAGTSERMKLPTAKQFLKVLGKHIIAYTVDSFHRLSWVRHIIVVVNADQVEFTQTLLESYGFSRVIVCAGSFTRHRSIHCGVKALRTECTDSDVVIIHDAARPFVPEDVALSVAKAAESHGAAGVTRPLVSTVIKGDEADQRLAESLDRTQYRNSEMPQAFQYGVISRAYEKCTAHDLDYGTECLLLAMKYSGCHAYLVEGTDDLWKVTYQKDLYSMESTVKEKLTVVSLMNICRKEFPALQQVQDGLYLRQLKVTCGTEEPANTFLVVLDSKCDSTSTFENLPSKIIECYSNLAPSAVGLDLMVLLMFVWDSDHGQQIGEFSNSKCCKKQLQQNSEMTLHSLQCRMINCHKPRFKHDHSSCFSDQTHGDNKTLPLSSQQCDEKDTIAISHGDSESQSATMSRDKSSLHTQTLRNTQLDPGSSQLDLSLEENKSAADIKSELVETSLTQELVKPCESMPKSVDSVSNLSQSMETDLPVKPEPGCIQNLQVTANSGWETNTGQNAFTESAISEDESQRICSVNTISHHDHPLQLDSHQIKHDSMSKNLTPCCGSGHHSVTGNFRDHTACVTLVKDFKSRLIDDWNGKPATVIGVSCQRQSSIVEQLTELIWNRSLSLDGQVLMYD